MPVRRLHNYLYCPRLFYLQWVEDLFMENAETTSGSAVHKRVDEPSHLREQDLDIAERAALRSVAVHSESLGLTGIVDLIEDTGNGRQLLDYKRGAPRRDEDGMIRSCSSLSARKDPNRFFGSKRWVCPTWSARGSRSSEWGLLLNSGRGTIVLSRYAHFRIFGAAKCHRPNPSAFWIPTSLTSRVLRCRVAS